MDVVSLLINLVSGAAGGNLAGAAMPDKSLGTLGNTVAGLVGGGPGRLHRPRFQSLEPSRKQWDRFRRLACSSRYFRREWCCNYGPSCISKTSDEQSLKILSETSSRCFTHFDP